MCVRATTRGGFASRAGSSAPRQLLGPGSMITSPTRQAPISCGRPRWSRSISSISEEGSGTADLAAQCAHELPGAQRESADQPPYLLEARAQGGVPDLDREHRVLQRRERSVRPAGGLHRAVEQFPDAVRGGPRGRTLEQAGGGKAAAGGELGVGALRSAVGQ